MQRARKSESENMAAVARHILASQASQSSADSASLNLTPVTQVRSAGIFAASPLSSPMLAHVVNDDNSEKKKRLKARLSDRVQRHMSSPASESRNKSQGLNLSGWNAAQISDHLHNCIQLSLENKINVKNAFSLHLIDTLKTMIHKEKETNFQMAGSSLEAGAKIYSNRVDALHLQAIQVHDQVSQIDRDGDKANIGNEEEADADADGSQDPANTARKKPSKKKKIIETDAKKLSIPNIDQMAEIDPLLQKLSKEGDSSFGGLLLSALRCADDDCALMLNMSCDPEPNPEIQLHTSFLTELELPDISIDSKVLCPTFHQFAFNKSMQHPIFSMLNSREEELRYDPDKDVSVDEGVVDDNLMPMNNMDNDDCEADQDNMFVECNTGIQSRAVTTVSNMTDGSLTTLLSLVSKEGGDYSFFANMKNMWAGPAHWKACKTAQIGTKRAGESILPASKKPSVRKTQVVLDFGADVDFDKKFKKTRAATTVTKSTLERYKKQLLTLPEDLHYNSKDLLKIFTKQQILTLQPNDGDDAQLAADQDGAAQNDYDYDNRNDMENFCPNVSGNDADDNDDFQFSEVSGSQQQTVLDFDDTLVNQPQMVDRINLQYAKRPKKVDFKRLKRNMWNLITEPEKENAGAGVEQPQRTVKNGTSFHQVYDKLPQLCPSHEVKDMSVPIAFVALLHMCNEKNLMLTCKESFEDLMIYAGDD